MNLSNNNNYVSKYYIKLFNIVPVEMESVQSFIDIAIALKGVLFSTFFHQHNLESDLLVYL